MHTSSRWLGLLSTGLLIAAFILAVWSGPARATVEYARMTGQSCATCHVRPEGGGALSVMGAGFARSGYQWPVPVEFLEATPQLSDFLRGVKLVAGFVHVIFATLWFGTILYIHIVVRPQQLTSGIPRTEALIGWVSIGVMAVTGITLTIFRAVETGAVFRGTWGTVFIIKLALYGLLVAAAAVATFGLSRRLRRRPAAAEEAGLVEAPAGPPSEAGAPTGPITPEALAALNGQEGARAIVAVDGKLYDVSNSRLWREGVHVRRHHAGLDLTEALAGAPHGPEVLERMPYLGELQTAAPAATGARPRRLEPRRIFVGLAYGNLVLMLGVLLCIAWWNWGFVARSRQPEADTLVRAGLTEASATCANCHLDNAFLAAQVAEWEHSRHAEDGVGCFECHGANAGDVDAMDHNGFLVSVLVTPNDCGECHVLEAEQFAVSYHAQAGNILHSLDNILGERVEGVAAAVLGCQQCHGAPVTLREDGTLDEASWPNTGMGRINPDGSRGACSTCHTRHLFSVAVAREPGACGNCHMGPDHPQKEIYEESKHGVAFAANRDRMALEAEDWVLGEDYTAAPTCATCHMSAAPGLAASHDVGLRISWTLRPPVSVHLDNWAARRDAMTQVCRQCHSPGFFTNYFAQYDDAVVLYNEKFALSAGSIMADLREARLLTPKEFDEQIEWTYYYLWHHEGRRARHGASMMGPDYVQWHGFYEVADRFYNELIPEAEELLPGVTEPYLDTEHHAWLTE